MLTQILREPDNPRKNRAHARPAARALARRVQLGMVVAFDYEVLGEANRFTGTATPD
jgi:hypothetical protein